jgi:hypothetical protein
MTEFSGRIISAEYMNAEYSLIKVRYDDDGKNAIYHLEVDPNNADFQALEADGWDAEKIIDATAESKRVQSNAWNLEVNAAAQVIVDEIIGAKNIEDAKQKLLAENERLQGSVAGLQGSINEKEEHLLNLDKDVKIKTNSVNHVIYDFIFEKNEDKEELFKFKLWALEQDCVKSASKEVKSSIRKAKRITTSISIVDGLI